MTEQKTCKACKKTFMVDPMPFVCEGCRNKYIGARANEISEALRLSLEDYAATSEQVKYLTARKRDIESDLADTVEKLDYAEGHLPSIIAHLAEMMTIRSMPFPG